QREEEKAVKSGYWATYRFNPELVGTDKNPFTLDSKEPTESFQEFLQGEVRFSSLKRAFPEIADELYAKTERDAKARLDGYRKLAGQA
ncbi:MAG: pyruvate-flavodoxin oxidoreductase, partial [Schwartzia sp.]|nr:pyruvate-flavodoxin oxidoreductase [Schwartzia sp. (in: firmicutes)]